MLGLLLAVLFIAVNAFFVAAEFALVKISTTLPSQPKVPREEPRVQRAREVVSRLDRYLSVTQFGITLASLGLGWIGEPALEGLIDRATFALLGREPGRFGHIASIALAFSVLTFGHVLFGELVPKLVAIQRPEKTALASAGPLHVVYLAFRPLLWVLERATSLILGLMGLSADAGNEGTLSEDELLGILAANAARTPEGKGRSELFHRVARFGVRTARHAMVPRVDMFSIPMGTTGEEAIAQLRTHQYSRVVLTRDKSVDEIAGYLYAKDFLLDARAPLLPSLEGVRRDILFVPESQTLLQVLEDMQKSQTPIAIVVDEYGGTSGLLTMEDLLEEIVGEIRDELDVEHARIVKHGIEADTYDVDARATIDELRPLGLHFDDGESSETVGTIVLQRLGRIPHIGDKVELSEDSVAEIIRMSRRRVVRVRLRLSTPAPADA